MSIFRRLAGTMSHRQRTVAHWDKLATDDGLRDFSRRSWGGIGQVHRNHNYLTTGDADYYWIDYVRDTFFRDGHGGDLISLGCGEGRIERLLKEHKFSFSSVRGYDLSPACIEKATALAEQCNLAPRIEYHCVDVNQVVLERDCCDFIVFFHSLHHVEALEHVIESCSSALRNDGLMLVNEFVGPSRFQWTDEQLRAADALLRLLPESLRLDLETRTTKVRNRRPTVAEMIAVDPSESVRSAEIESVLRRHFDVLEEKPWGGTLLYLIFENIAGNFSPGNPYHDALVEILIHHENTIIENGILPSDFKFFMLRPRRDSA